jgi:DNA-binding transcriptional regulator PaaX
VLGAGQGIPAASIHVALRRAVSYGAIERERQGVYRLARFRARLAAALEEVCS